MLLKGERLELVNGEARRVGYDVVARCDEPECKAIIERGLEERCGGLEHVPGAPTHCGRYFCPEHLKGREICYGQKLTVNARRCERCLSGLPPWPMRPDLSAEEVESWLRSERLATFGTEEHLQPEPDEVSLGEETAEEDGVGEHREALRHGQGAAILPPSPEPGSAGEKESQAEAGQAEPSTEPLSTDSGATISEDGKYRYLLWRRWKDGPSHWRDGPLAVCWVMLNPSTADAAQDDPTIRRCIGFSKLWGYERLVVVNLFAYRATAPHLLERAVNPKGDGTDRFILEAARCSGLVIAAWGVHGELFRRDRQVRDLLAKAGVPLHHLGLTRGGHPRHPLYVEREQRPVPWA